MQARGLRRLCHGRAFAARSWVEYDAQCDFPLQNLPFGVFSCSQRGPRCATAIGHYALDLALLAEHGFLQGLGFDERRVFRQPALNAFMSLPRPAWRATRARLTELLSEGDERLRRSDLRETVLRPLQEVKMHLPAKIGDYTDFYSSREHATNVGIMFRGKDNALQPNWLHLPVGYHGRASSVVVSGTPLARPRGQLQKSKEDPWQGSVYGPCKLLDFELEIGCFVGGELPPLGRPLSIAEAAEHVFGYVLMNDWSARDIQAWEYVPLGPFGAKNFGTTISPWVVTPDALEPFVCATSAGTQSEPQPLPYLQEENYSSYDIKLAVDLHTPSKAGSEKVITTITESNFRHMYWTPRQQLVHHSVTGCNMAPGDLLGSGTISGTEQRSYGSMLELSWRGANEIPLADGQVRKFLQDGDVCNVRGFCQGEGFRVGFGDCSGEVLPAGTLDQAPCIKRQEQALKDVELYGYWRSGSSWRVRIALAHHGVDFKNTPATASEQLDTRDSTSGHVGSHHLAHFLAVNLLKDEQKRCFAYAEAILLDLRWWVTLQAEHLHLRHQALANQEGFIKDLLATLLSGLSLKDWPLATLVLEPNRNMEVECRASQPMALYHLVFLEELIRVLRPLVSLEELDRMLGLLDHLTELEDYHRGCFLLLRCWESRHFLIERINMDIIKVPLEKRGIKLLQSFQEGSQPRRIADTVPTEVLLSSRGYSAILTALQEKYAPVLEASGPKAIDRFLFEGERQKGESYTSFIAAKEIARQEMESFLGEKVCDKLCGRILLRQAGLNELQREMITLKGPILRGFNEIAEMLRPLDRPEMLARGEDTKVTKNFHQEHYLQEFPESYDYDHYSGNFEDHEDHIDYPYEYEPEWEHEDEPENPVAIDDEGNAHFFMEDREYTEEESKYLEAYVSAYRDVRKELQKRRTDRGYTRRGPPFRDGKGGKKGRGKFRFSGRGKGKGGDKGKGQGQMRGTSEDLILRTRCFNCNELGHYAKDCPLQTKGAGKGTNKKMFIVSSGNNTATQPMVFMMTTNLKEMPQTDARTTQPTLAKRLMIFAGVKCRPQEALVDTAAEDAVIGSTAMRQLTIELHRRGLRPLPVSAGVPLPGAGGIGGAAVVESMMEVPLGIASNNCVLRFTILRDSDQFQTPPLLTVSFLESVEAIIDLQNELCIINGTPTPMTRLPSAHRTINILDFDQDGWDLPVERRKNPKIDPFKLPPKGITNFFEGGTITVWLQSTKGTTFVQTLPGGRDHLVIPNECSGLPKEGLSPHRRTFAIFADGHDITIDVEDASEKPHTTLDLENELERAARLVRETTEPEKTEKAKKDPCSAWRRLSLALLALIKVAQDQMIVDYLMKTKNEDFEQEKLNLQRHTNKSLKKKTVNDIRQGIGAQLSRSGLMQEMPEDSKEPGGTTLEKTNGETDHKSNQNEDRSTSQQRSRGRTLTGTLPTRRAKTPVRFNMDKEVMEVHSDTDTWDDVQMIDRDIQLEKPLQQRMGLMQKLAFVICCTCSTACGYDGAVQAPYAPRWLGDPSELYLLHDENSSQKWMKVDLRRPEDFTNYRYNHAYWVFPCNYSNSYWAMEDDEWPQPTKEIPKQVKTLIYATTKTKYGVDVMEIYSPPRVTEKAEKVGMSIGGALDLRNGWDFCIPAHREQARRLVARLRPALIVLSPPCTTFSPLRRLSNPKRQWQIVKQEEDEGRQHWHFALELAEVQHSNHRGFLLEHPAPASSWQDQKAKRLRERPDVYTIRLDMCAFALTTKEGIPAKKPTIMVTNVWPLVKTLSKKCPGVEKHQKHQPLIGGRAAAAALYTPQLVTAIVDGLNRHLRALNIHYHNCEEPPSFTTTTTSNRLGSALPDHLQALADEISNTMAQPMANYIHQETSFAEEYLKFCHYQHFPSHRILGGRQSSRPVSAPSTASVPSTSKSSAPLEPVEEELEGQLEAEERDTERREGRPLRSRTARPALDDEEKDPAMRNAAQQLQPVGETPSLQRAAKQIDSLRNHEDGQWSLAPDLRRELYRLHRNLGHPDNQTFVRALNHANAKSEVIEWTKKFFNCPLCEGRRKPTAPRPGYLARNLPFNEVVGVDTFFYKFHEQEKIFLNCVCWATGLQIVEEIPQKTAFQTFQSFAKIWLVHYGHPTIVIIDQGTEYTGQEFQGRLHDMGVMVHAIDARSPWQNGKTERAGGIFKEKLSLLLEEIVATTEAEFSQCVWETQIARNRYMNKSGFSPFQRVFGYTPRLPASLASDDVLNPMLVQESATESMKRAWQIRDAAAAAWMKQRDSEMIRNSVRKKTRNADQKPLEVGDWVYVWRDTEKYKGWSGPGVIIAENANGKSLWISLRNHLIKASREQVRNATSEEHLGAELIRELSKEMVDDIHQGKIRHYHDIESEGGPGEEEQWQVTISDLGALDEDGKQEVSAEQPPTPEPQAPQPGVANRDMEIDDDEYTPEHLDGVLTGANRPEAGDITMEEDPTSLGDNSTRAPSVAPESTDVNTANESRRTSVRVDEGRENRIEFGPVRAQDSASRPMPYPFSSASPTPWPSPTSRSFFMEAVSFDEPKPKFTKWSGDGDGAAWWTDRRTQRSGIAPLDDKCFTLNEAEGSYSYKDRCIYLTKAKTSPGQVVFNKLSEEHLKIFRAARAKEVNSLLETGAITILSPDESRDFRRDYPEGILDSRYVDRWKPSGKFAVLPEEFDMEGFEPAKHEGLSAKSRWCVVGWQDPMIHHIERAAPTPLTSSMRLFFQLAACRKWPARVKDAKTAFLQSKPTTRSRKLACRMPRDEAFEGYREDQLIMLNTEVYGLVSGPAWWRRSFLEILVKQLGYRINCFDRCVLTLDSESRETNAATQGMIVIEVDDVLEAGNKEHQRRMSALESMLKFGKAVELQSDAAGTGFAGRRVWQEADFSFSITMQDYIQSRLKPVRLEAKTLKCQAKDKTLSAEEVSQLRGTLASINWVAREGRPDASAAASILAGCFPTPSVADAMEANRVVAKIKGHHIQLKIHSFPEEDLRHLLIADSSFDPSGKSKPQHGWLQATTTDQLNLGKTAPVSLITWRSRKLRRKAGSTNLCEAISMSTALGSMEKQVAMLESLRFSRYSPRHRLEIEDDGGLQGEASVIASENPTFQDPAMIAVIDAKSVFDSVKNEQAQGEDDRAALEVALIKESLSKVRGRIRWVPHNENPADMLTKVSGAHEEPMMRLLATNTWRLEKEEEVLAQGRQGLHRRKTTAKPTSDQPTCQKTCMGHTCDFWSAVASNTCTHLEETGCDCSGCACVTDEPQETTLAPGCEDCHGETCDFWIAQYSAYTCESLKSDFQCNCNGCACEGGTTPPTTVVATTTMVSTCAATCFGRSCDSYAKDGKSCEYLETFGCSCEGCACTLDDRCEMCLGKSCDDFAVEGYSCDYLKDHFGCDCNKCKCELQNESCPRTCGDETCTFWAQQGYTCSELESTYGCNCNGCQCGAEHRR
ncbi:unnamed protein product [Effrenium voratum]|nr:unnamed protein product [Effrenium voratum]